MMITGELLLATATSTSVRWVCLNRKSACSVPPRDNRTTIVKHYSRRRGQGRRLALTDTNDNTTCVCIRMVMSVSV